jgi:hypothetical protein
MSGRMCALCANTKLHPRQAEAVDSRKSMAQPMQLVERQLAQGSISCSPEATMSACGRSAHHRPEAGSGADSSRARGQASRRQPTSTAAQGRRAA